MKILVAADGSPFSKRMLAYIAAHDEWLGAQHAYTVITAVPPVPPSAVAVLDKANLKAYYDESAEKVFKPMRAFFAQQGLKAQFVSKVGPAAETLVAAADKGGFDLLILGSHGHGSVLNLLLGSVATKVVAHSKTPVLLVR
jgi:nucleotide-binding universal stress UspA family protein